MTAGFPDGVAALDTTQLTLAGLAARVQTKMQYLAAQQQENAQVLIYLNALIAEMGAILNPAPGLVAVATATPSSAIAGTAVLLSRFGSADPQDPNNRYTVTWDPGDGTAILGPFVGAAGDVSHVYASAGTFNAVLTLTSAITLTSTTAIVVVTVASVAAVASVVIDPPAVSGLVGAVVALTATDLDASNNALTGRTDTWASSAPGVAALQTTTGDGVLVNLLAAGTSNITATAGGVTSANCVVTVTALTAVGFVTITPTSPPSTLVGANLPLTVSVTT